MPRNAVAFEVSSQDNADAHRPRAYWFMRNQADIKMGIGHACPCGCGMQSAMWFEGLADAGGPEWKIVKPFPQATLSPSIGIGKDEVTGRYHWHGFLEDGVER